MLLLTTDVVDFCCENPASAAYPKSRLKHIEVFAFDDDSIRRKGEVGGARFVRDFVVFESDVRGGERQEDFLAVRTRREVRKNTKTYGFSLGRCDVPGQKKQEDVEVPNGMVELGLGIHNEPGFETVPFESASKTIEIVGRVGVGIWGYESKEVRIGRWRGIVGKVDEMLGLDGETKMNIGLLKPIELCLVVNGLGNRVISVGLLAPLSNGGEKRG